MIETIKLSKRYEDGVYALQELDLKVDRGEIYCLLGANGAGKTTAINLLLGFLRPTAGKILIDGLDVDAEPLKAKERVAFLSENVTLYRHLTATQNLDYFSRLWGGSRSRDAYHEVMRGVGLPESAFERRVRTFSKGMRQKLGIAIAILKNAPVLLLDEPMSGLDPKAAAELVETLKRIRDDGKAILMSTHDIFRTKELADRVGILREGRKAAERTRAELATESLEQLYLACMREEAAVSPVEPESGSLSSG